MDSNTKQVLSDTWYLVRVVTGMFLQVFMFFCTVAWVEHTYAVLEIISHETDPISHAYSRQVHLLVALAVFAAGMAGVNWAKCMYVRHVLPEVMDDVTKKIVAK